MTEPELRDVMNAACRALQNALPPDTGFIFVCASAGGGLAQYAGNVPRPTGQSIMQEVLDRWDDGNFVPR